MVSLPANKYAITPLVGRLRSSPKLPPFVTFIAVLADYFREY
jgi:hypothetical protein